MKTRIPKKSAKRAKRRTPKRRATRAWLVELMNNNDRRDDEVWQVRATSKTIVRSIVGGHFLYRFTVGRIIPARGGSKRMRELAREFRTYCTQKL